MTSSRRTQRVWHRLVTRATTNGPVAGDAGFTVIEVLVALTLFAVVSAAAVTAIIGGQRAEDDTRNRVAAANIAQSDLEQARAVPSPAGAAYSSSAPGGGPSYSVRRTVSYPSTGATPCPVGKLMTVSVVVSWSSGSVRNDSLVACP